MKKVVHLGLLLVLATAMATTFTTASREQSQASGDRQAISYDKWQAAKENAEKNDRDGNYVTAL